MDPRPANESTTGLVEPLAPLCDRYGRALRDLRLSVTDHCNLRCGYCMPPTGVPWLSREQMLTQAEILRLVRLFVGMGITSIRLTGGEPLLRADLVQIVAGIAATQPRPRLAMTTNGIGLAEKAEALARAGLQRVNVSLDTTDPAEYRGLTHRDRFDEVLAGLTAAAKAGLSPIKVNAVIQAGTLERAGDLLDFCLAHGYQLRFIEQMPLDAQHRWQRPTMVTAATLRAQLQRRFPLVPTPVEERGSAPEQLFRIEGTSGTVGIIASVTEPFCGACDRVRVTADGMLRNCLFARGEADLRGPLRAGVEDAELIALIRSETARKAAGHGIGSVDFTQPARPMSAIGG